MSTVSGKLDRAGVGSLHSRVAADSSSCLPRSQLSRCWCFGGYEFDQRLERGDSEVHVVKEVWLKDVIGNRQLLLFSQEGVYRTQQCRHWSSDSGRCNLSLRCNGKGTAVCCGWYSPRKGRRDDDYGLIRCEETLHLYERMFWDVETPREYASHTVVSGRAWVRKGPDAGSLNATGSLVNVWLDPIEYQIRSFRYDPVL